MPTNERMIILEARRLQRLSNKRSRLRREIKAVEKEMRLVRRNLRALAKPIRPEPDDLMPPLRMFGESGGVK